MVNYVSIFADPKIKVCTNPSDASRYNLAHADPKHSVRLFGPPCPVHRTDKGTDNHELWFKWLKKFLESGSDYDKNMMLKYVTDTCPPDAPRKRKRRR